MAQDYPNSPSFSSCNSNVSFIEIYICLLIPRSIKTVGLPRWPGGKQSACQGRRCRDADSIHGSGRSPGGGNGNSLQYSCLGNSMKRETWRAIVHGVTKHQTQLCIAVVQLLSCLTLCDPIDCSTSGFPVLHYLLESSQTQIHWVDDAIQPSYTLSPSSHPALNLSQHQGLFQLVGSSHQVAKVLELQLQHRSFQWIFKVDFFRIDWFDLLAVQGTLKSFLQHHNSKASILQHSAFFMVQLSHPYKTNGKET